MNYAWCVALIITLVGCDKENESAASINSQEVQIEVECPKMDSWSTEEINNTRNEYGNRALQKDETDGLDMIVCTVPDTIRKATTRWTNIDNNTVFRVVAYACASAAAISTANYKGYGDYQYSTNGTVNIIKNLTLPIGTYTFVCYSYGRSVTMSDFSNSTTTIAATNGQNLMTCIKPNISIQNTGIRYTLSNITFTNRLARYRILVTAQSGRMDNITSCSATLTLPLKSMIYSFTNDRISANEPGGSINIAWTNPNAMAVHSQYVYILPMNQEKITVNLNITIGGKAFTNKSVTLSGLTLNPSQRYCSNVSFTTTEGYIVAGAFWAPGNLYKDGNQYKLYNSTETYVADANSGAFFTCNNPNPYPNRDIQAPWTDVNDPCRKVELLSSTSKWRLPNENEVNNLLNTSYQMDATISGITGYLFGKILFLPYSGYIPQGGTNHVEKGERGLFWYTPGRMFSFSGKAHNAGSGIGSIPWDTFPKNSYAIRCVRNI